MEDIGTLKRGITALIVLSLLLPCPVLAYCDNGRAHNAINGIAFEKFVKECIPNDHTLQQCSIDRGIKFVGPAWDPDMGDYLIGVAEPQMRPKTIEDWLKSGGYSADMPEIPTGIRHFYNPVGNDPQLTDYIEPKAAALGLLVLCGALTMEAGKGFAPFGLALPAAIATAGTCGILIVGHALYAHTANSGTAGNDIDAVLSKERSVKINAVQWAFDHPENPYSFNMAKKYYANALGSIDYSPDSQKASDYAKAWRAVGESMHMIADMTVPAHVRNDGHGINSDPYEGSATAEEIMKYNNPQLFTPYSSLPYECVKNGIPLKSLMREVAKYTNRDFFSMDTITYEVKDKMANNQEKFKSPMEIPKEYDNDPNFKNSHYYNTVDGRRMKLAYDNSWLKCLWKNANPSFGLDKEVLADQRSILIPTAIKASTSVIDFFLPRFEVIIDKVEDDQSSGKDIKKVEGYIKHIPTAEWPASSDLTIRNGAYIKVTDKDGKETSNKISCPDRGSLNEVKWKGELKTGDKVTLEYNLGGYVIKSKPYILNPQSPCSTDTSKLNKKDTGEKNEDGMYEVYYTDSGGLKQGPYRSYFDKDKEELSSTGCYLNDKQNGHWIYWIKAYPVVESGEKIGTEVKGRMEGDYKDGKKEGVWIDYCPDGEKAREVSYKNDKLDGHCVSYSCETRYKEYESNYKDGEQVGEMIVYDERGNMENTIA